MREVAIVLWWFCITAITIESWFDVDSVESFIASILAWLILVIIPAAVFPVQRP